jgi:DNA-binding Xre family transcriptional regulator
MVKDEYIKIITKDKVLRTKIMLVSEISNATIYRWLGTNNKSLTTPDVVRVICDHLHIDPSQLLETSKRITI